MLFSYVSSWPAGLLSLRKAKYFHLRDFLEELLKQNKHLIEIEDANRKLFTKTLFSMSVFIWTTTKPTLRKLGLTAWHNNYQAHRQLNCAYAVR